MPSSSVNHIGSGATPSATMPVATLPLACPLPQSKPASSRYRWRYTTGGRGSAEEPVIPLAGPDHNRPPSVVRLISHPLQGSLRQTPDSGLGSTARICHASVRWSCVTTHSIQAQVQAEQDQFQLRPRPAPTNRQGANSPTS